MLKIACRMLGLEIGTSSSYRDFGDELRRYAKDGPSPHRRRVELAIAFATYEEHLGVWYDWTSYGAYFDLLELNGYETSDVERKKLKRKPKAA